MPGLGRGRPLKFGRRAQAAVLTLPDDVFAWLRSLHPDPAWAIVSLFEQRQPDELRGTIEATGDARLVRLPGDVSLIIVDPDLCRDLEGVSVIRLADGGALLALDHGRGVADLELAILDRLEALEPDHPLRARLAGFRNVLKRWRQNRAMRFESRSIIVARDRNPDRAPRPLSRLQQDPEAV